MKKNISRNILYAAGIVLLFLAISYAFVPEVLGGKIVNQSDISGWTGMTNEVITYNEAHPDDPSFWTNSMFGGMPTISMYGIFKGDWTNWIYDLLLTGARPATYLFISLLGGFLLMLAFGIRPVLAIAGAIAVTFCSYNLQIIQVGHNTKMQAIAYMPWVLAALVFTYKSAAAVTRGRKEGLLKPLFGAVLFAFALSFQIKANHPQISYYLAIIILAYVLAVFIKILAGKDRKPALARFFIASALLLATGCLGIATNLNKLLPTYEYAEYSMRGGSELGKSGDGQEAGGLDIGYATAWSYGIEETPNLLIPDFNGGSSAGDPGLKNSEVRDLLKRARQPQIDEVMRNLPLYWGPQPFTAGPMYMGAISIFLFILGLFIVKGRDKWWLAVCTVLAILLAWGSHFLWFTRLWYDWVPLYNKFRTVSMALVILQVTVPLLGFIALDRIWKEGQDRKKALKAAWAAYGIAGGLCLLFALFPALAGSFTGSADAGLQDVLAEAIRADRKAMLVKDATRSLVFVTLAFAMIFWSLRSRKSSGEAGSPEKRYVLAGAAMAVLVLLDLGSVGKRYLNSSHFVSRSDFSSQFEARPVDNMILEDKSLDYRVLDLSVNTFNDSHTSYWHKSVGGYSPAKLQRYQDLIERYLSGEINRVIRTVNSSATIQEVEDSLPDIPVLSMLNDKYIIVDGDLPPVENRQAFGNCWFVYSAKAASGPDEEIALLGETDLRTGAVIGDDFAWARERLDSLATLARYDIAPADSIWMTSYAPNELRYRSRTNSENAVIFSEIYYPEGWSLTIDGKPAGLFRANWILRGAFIPAGEHEIVMRFDPQVYRTGETLSRASSIALFILLLLSGAGMAAIRRQDRPGKKEA